MATVKFKKKVARPGVVLPKNPLGRRRVKVIDKDYLSRVAETGNEMLKAGILIPMPYGHTDENGVYPVPLLRGINDSLVDARSGEVPRWDHAVNSGFATGFEIDPVDGGLIVESEHEGDPENQDTHAGRIGKTFKQTSPFITDWTDGSGKHWKDAPLHICLTNRGVQHAQEEFKLLTPEGNPNQDLIAKQGLTSPELAIAMSLDDDDYCDKNLSEALALSADDELSSLANAVKEIPGLTPEIVNKIKEQFKSKLNLTLPDDTDINNFGDRVFTILNNMEPRKEGDDITKMPSGSDVVTAPLIMSNDPTSPLTPGTNASVPAPGSVATPALANPDDLVISKKQAEGILVATLSAMKANLTKRINAMVKSGHPIVGRAYADSNLLPQVNAIALSLDDLSDEGQFPKTPLELSLDILEGNGGTALIEADGEEEVPEGGIIPNETADMANTTHTEMTPDEVNKMYNEALGIPS